MKTKLLLLLIALVIVVGAIFFWQPPGSHFHYHLSSHGKLNSSQVPSAEILMEAEGHIRIASAGANSFRLATNIHLKTIYNGSENKALSREVEKYFHDPIEVEVNQFGQAVSIGFEYSLGDMNAEIALNLWRMLVNAFFVPTQTGERLGRDLWGSAEISVACDSECTLNAKSLGAPMGAKLTGTTEAKWKKGKDGKLLRLHWRAKNEITHPIFQSSSENEVSLEETLLVAKLPWGDMDGAQKYPASIENDGARNKLRSLRNQYKGVPFSTFLRLIRSSGEKSKPTDIYQTIETALLLFPEKSLEISELIFSEETPKMVRPILVSALLHSRTQAGQEVAQNLFLDPRFQPFLSTALFSLTFDSNSVLNWVSTMNEVAKKHPEFSEMAKLNVCSLAGALEKPEILAETWNKDPASLSPQQLNDSLACLGNSGLPAALEFIERTWNGTASTTTKSSALLALRFIRDKKVMIFYSEAAKNSSLLAPLLQSIQLRLTRGIQDPGIKALVQSISLENSKGRSDLVQTKKKILAMLGEEP